MISPPTAIAFTEATREHYAALYALPGAMHSGFAQFAAFDQDAIDNKAFLAEGKLSMPVLALGGEKSFGLQMAELMRFAATDVQGASFRTAGTGSWRRTRRRRSSLSTPFSMPSRRTDTISPARLQRR